MSRANFNDVVEGGGLELPVVTSITSNEDEYNIVEQVHEDHSNDDNDDDEFSSSDHNIIDSIHDNTRLYSLQNDSYQYRASVRRQNCFFGFSLLSLTLAFIAAYTLMGFSFTPSNIGIFGDESSRKGGSGEVGLDADNAKSQQIVDEEVIEIEYSEEFGGDTGQIDSSPNLPRGKIMNKMIHSDQDEVGKHPWVEDKDWWKKHAPNLDTSNMTPEQKQQFVKMEKKTNHMKKKILALCRKNPESDECKKATSMSNSNLDLNSIKDKLANHYNHDSVGEGKESFPDKYVAPPDRNKNDKSTGVPAIQTISSDFIVLEQVNHDPTSFTQGLSYGDDGTVYETTGLYGESKVRRINSTSFDVKLSIDVDNQYFGEGSTFFRDRYGNGRLIQITWQEQTGFIYDSETLEKISEFKYTTTSEDGNQGWGITYDAKRQEFIVSDGSHYLYFWDRDTLAEMRRVGVSRFDGYEQRELNELEFIDGLVCCNIWHSDHIICVDPETGQSVREYDMSNLWPGSERGGSENVLNGIAFGNDHVLLGGKRWNRMYKVRFPDWPFLR